MTAMRFGVVIVNYQCASFAVDAALSALGDGAAAAVIVDNASPDGSAAFIEAILSGETAHAPDAPREPIAGHAPRFADISELAPGALSLIRSEINDGFASGCALGLKALAERDDIDAFVLLNPDATLAQGSLDAFAARLADARAGLCGASVVAFEPPHAAQAFGGAELTRFFHLGRNIGEGAAFSDAPPREQVEERLAYPIGAAMALRRDYLIRAGYPDARYFLYFEEPDWTLAGRPDFYPAWAPGAVAYHRYGAASKSERTEAGGPSRRSPLSDYHMARSRLLFALKWRPLTAPLVGVASLAQAAIRVLRSQPDNAAAVLRGGLPGAPRRFQTRR